MGNIYNKPTKITTRRLLGPFCPVCGRGVNSHFEIKTSYVYCEIEFNKHDWVDSGIGILFNLHVLDHSMSIFLLVLCIGHTVCSKLGRRREEWRWWVAFRDVSLCTKRPSVVPLANSLLWRRYSEGNCANFRHVVECVANLSMACRYGNNRLIVSRPGSW